jgi:YfiH family protein
MFYYRDQPADGIGVAFTDAIGPAGAVLDLGIRPRVPQWDELETTLGVPIYQVIQVHSARVVVVDGQTDAGQLITEEADALVSAEPGIGLAVRVADCVPVLFTDSVLIAAAHAGRVGLDKGVLGATVARLRELGAGTLRAWIGPHICGSCYEVPAELREDFCQHNPSAWSQTSWGTPALDLGKLARTQLRDLGVAVESHDPCTLENGSLYSYRRDKGASGRMGAVIWRSPQPAGNR